MATKSIKPEQTLLNKKALEQKDRFALVASADNLQGRQTSFHSHSEGQLIYCIKGTVLCTFEKQIFVATPFRAVWIPSETNHCAYSKGHTVTRSVYIRKEECQTFLDKPKILHVSTFLKELILKVSSFNLEFSPTSHDILLLKVLKGEIEHSETRSSQIPKVRDKRLQNILEEIFFNPLTSLNEVEKNHHISSRTLKRLFQNELGITFTSWRQQARINLATRLLDENKLNITEIAYECGYESFSAFSLAFKKIIGLTPSTYRKE